MGFKAIYEKRDLLPEQIAGWQDLEEKVKKDNEALCNFMEIGTAIFDSTELFFRSIG